MSTLWVELLVGIKVLLLKQEDDMFADFCFQSGEGSIMPDDSCVSHFLLIKKGAKNLYK